MSTRSELSEELLNKVRVNVIQEIYDFIVWKQHWVSMIHDDRLNELQLGALEEMKELATFCKGLVQENPIAAEVPSSTIAKRLGITTMKDIIKRNGGKE